MSTAAERRHVFSLADYVRVAERSENRLEFWEGAILDMSGGSPRHSAICGNVIRIIGAQLRGGPCRVFDANLRVRSIPANRSTYADATVVGGPLEIDPADRTRRTVLNPTILVEVPSPTTESDDRGAKLDCYKLIGSVRAIVLVAQDTCEVTVHSKQDDGSFREARYREGDVGLVAIACSLPVAEIYEQLPDA